jgi:hypothetical protein
MPLHRSHIDPGDTFQALETKALRARVYAAVHAKPHRAALAAHPKRVVLV